VWDASGAWRTLPIPAGTPLWAGLPVDGEDAWVASGAVGGFCDTAVKANGQVTWSAASCAIAAISVVEFDCAGADPSYRNRSELPHC
jgi:hypothetical protein